MKHHVKAARAYRLELPTVPRLTEHFEPFQFVELTPTAPYGLGFVPPIEGIPNLVVKTTEPNIVVFAVRYDEKILPAPVVKAEVAKVVDTYEQEGRRVGRKEQRDIRESITPSLLAKSHTKTTILRCFYHYGERLLIIPVAGKKFADAITGLLVLAVEAIKATTIYVAGANCSLTTRLVRHLDTEPDAFDTFGVGGQCVLKTQTNGKVAVKLDDIEDAYKGLTEAIGTGALVTEIALSTLTGIDFRLTQDFVLKGIKWGDEAIPEGDSDADADYRTRQDMAVELTAICGIVNALCDMLGYKEENADADLLG